MTRVLVPPHAGVLSALGLAVAPERRTAIGSVMARLDDMGGDALAAVFDGLASRNGSAPNVAHIARMRYRGQGHELEVSFDQGMTPSALGERFAALHVRRYGFVLPLPVEVVSARSVRSGDTRSVALSRTGASTWSKQLGVDDGGPLEATVAWSSCRRAAGCDDACPGRVDGSRVADRRLVHGTQLERPKTKVQSHSAESRITSHESRACSIPSRLSVMSHAVSMIAEEMGTVLERGALSPNIRERRDASSALFDASGRMIAQAAHIPVHLGAMPESVRAVLERNPAPGDVFLLNDPYRGGSHLPDLTMVEAIGLDGELVGFAAVRAHHADVGGMSPGSMPRGATELVQEGIIVPPVRIARGDTFEADILALVLANVRTPDERMGDLKAQRAACAAGRDGWVALLQKEGVDRMKAAGDGAARLHRAARPRANRATRHGQRLGEGRARGRRRDRRRRRRRRVGPIGRRQPSSATSPGRHRWCAAT